MPHPPTALRPRRLYVLLCAVFVLSLGAGPLDPRGKVHMPIGIPNTLDTLKTFVEPEGNFSPGVGTYGVYFWLYDHQDNKLYAPTQPGATVTYGLHPGGLLLPWAEWNAGGFRVRSELAQVKRASKAGQCSVVGANVTVTNASKDARRPFSLYAALRTLGPAGGPVREIGLDDDGGKAVMTLLVDGRCAIVPDQQPADAGVLADDTAGEWAEAGRVPRERAARSPDGHCSGVMRFAGELRPGSSQTFGFVCPVLPGRRAARHQWDGTSEWAQLDLAAPNPAEGGLLQPDPGIASWRQLTADEIIGDARRYWHDFLGGATVRTPDARWGEAFAAITAHAAMAMNEGAPDVTVVNYNVFNRDGVYTTSILHKVGRFDLAAECIDYFLAHPFNGRVYPEADNPGQILWIMGEHWEFTRDEAWLDRVYPAVQKLVAMIRYYRTTPGPHWVNVDSLEFGDALPPEKRQKLEPGRCDGHHPEYTEAFDVAGLRAAGNLAHVVGTRNPAAGITADLATWPALERELFDAYQLRFGKNLRNEYGSYCVLWPCRLYPLQRPEAREQFGKIGLQEPKSWRYFPLATAHQGLLAGSRAAAHETIDVHLDHEQMAGGEAAGRGWYAFDEGGKSGPGGWHHLRTTWDKDVAMPHGWAVAELHLLIRDSLLYEDGNQLVLFAGVPPEWFAHKDGVEVKDLPTHFGRCSFKLSPTPDGATLDVTVQRDATVVLAVRAPPGVNVKTTLNGRPVRTAP